MAAVAAAIQIAAAIGQTVSSLQAANRNASRAEAEGSIAMQQARIEEAQSRRRSAQIMGKQNAIAAAAGVDTTTGTPLEVALDSAEQAEMEALNIRWQGKLGKWAKQTEAEDYRASRAGIIFQGLGQSGSVLSQWKRPTYGGKP